MTFGSHPFVDLHISTHWYTVMCADLRTVIYAHSTAKKMVAAAAPTALLFAVVWRQHAGERSAAAAGEATAGTAVLSRLACECDIITAGITSQQLIDPV